MDVPLSLDSDFDELRDKDRTVELVGYVHQILGLQVVRKGSTKYDLFKFTLSNDSQRKIHVLIWGKELIDKYQSELTTDKIIHLDGAHCKAAQLSYRMESENFVPYELIIQKSTVVQYLGFKLRGEHVAPQTPKEVTFQNINEVEGMIRINGYVKTKFALTPSRFDNATYGCGSITDGEFKITVHIANYVSIDIEKGVAVTIVGEVNTNSNEPLTITCRDNDGITINTELKSLPLEKILRGVKTPKRKLAPA